jgi:ribosomal protein L11 methyltransferase
VKPASTYYVRISIPRFVRLAGKTLGRDSFYAWLWREFERIGFLGIHEGTLLAEDAAKEGLETESWTIDAAEAPRERDWVAGSSTTESVLYFSNRKGADRALKQLGEIEGLVIIGKTEEQPPQDWDAEWKASYKGAKVRPFWNIVPPWMKGQVSKGELELVLNPGAGFGTGTHETTQLCLEAIATSPKPSAVLDFGSGSGILAIGAALLGATVDAVEIDPLAVENAKANSALNAVEDKISFSLELGSLREYEMVIANILRPVLIQFAPELVARLKEGGTLILSGLMEPDVELVLEKYSKLITVKFGDVYACEKRQLNEWRALVFKDKRLPSSSLA